MDKTVTEALALMDARVQQIMKSDPRVRSRESAIARVASAPIGSIDWGSGKPTRRLRVPLRRCLSHCPVRMVAPMPN